ncbi:MAG: isopentenyl-diphosphate Delta-isomerase [Pyrinomonadaceae bacterium]
MKYNGYNRNIYIRRAAGLAVLLLLAAVAFFMANVPMPPWAHLISGLNVVLFALPALWAASRWLGRRDAFVLFAVLGVLALAIETLAIATGFPYGHFGYSDLLGYRILGYTPWTVSLAWTPLVLAAYAVARTTCGSPVLRIALFALLLIVFDLVLDPGAVRLGFWEYGDGGDYYGVPFTNFAGWIFSGAVAAAVMEVFDYVYKPLLRVPAQLASSGFLTVFFWTAFAVFTGMVVPSLIGGLTLVLLVAWYKRYRYAFDDMIVYVDKYFNPIGTASKLPAHNKETRLHRAFSVFIFNDQGELLLQQRAFTKKTWPGVWSNSCCGHVMLHESTEAAAKRRLDYELGIRNVKLESILPEFRYRAEKDGVVENEICPVLVGFDPSTPNPNPAEVNATKWVRWDKFVEDVKDPANGFSPWAVEEVELLAADERFRELHNRSKNGGSR